MSELKEECAVAGVISKGDNSIFKETVSALKRLQHRGQDAAGICIVKGNSFELFKDNGLVKEVLGKLDEKTTAAIAHARYSTSGDLNKSNAQPVLYNDVALCHNGTILNIEKYRQILLKEGYGFEGNSDSEVVLKWLFYKKSNFELDNVKDILQKDFKDSAYCILLLLKDRIMAFKDINSYRPLVFVEKKEAYYLLSEDCAVSKPYLKRFELNAAEAVEIKKDGSRLSFSAKPEKTNRCVFEAVYFASAKSCVFDLDVKKIRTELGKILAQDDPVDADCVIPVMNSGYWGALGYCREKNIPLKVLIKNKQSAYRTFIENNETRQFKIDEKYIINKEKIKNKRVVVVDDSVVRGATAKKIISLLKESGAREIHFRLTSPMIINCCFWGVDIKKRDELLAYKLKTIDNIREELCINSVKFIDNSKFQEIFDRDIWCHKCFTD